MNTKSRGVVLGAMLIAMLAASIPVRAWGADPLGEFGSDFRYTMNNGTEDAQDILTAPFHFNLDMLAQPKVYFTLLGAGAALGGAFALDSTMRAQLRGMSNSAATALEDAGTYSLSAAAGLIYISGLITNDERARHDMITTGEGVAAATTIAVVFKYMFGRERPNAGGVKAWFDGGQSFFSGETTPAFALAAGISQHYNYAWYVAVPAYSAAVGVGLGRMGHNAHWFSDVVMAGLVGVGTTELLYYLHRQHEEHPSSHYWIFPTTSDRGGTGVGVGYDW